MGNPQITLRLSPSHLGLLDQYIERTGVSTIEVVVNAIAKYLNCAEELPLSQRMTELEKVVAKLEAKERVENY